MFIIVKLHVTLFEVTMLRMIFPFLRIIDVPILR